MFSRLGAILVYLGALSGHLRAILTCYALAWVYLGGILAHSGPSWAHLGANLGPRWAHSRPFLGR